MIGIKGILFNFNFRLFLVKYSFPNSPNKVTRKTKKQTTIILLNNIPQAIKTLKSAIPPQRSRSVNRIAISPERTPEKRLSGKLTIKAITKKMEVKNEGIAPPFLLNVLKSIYERIKRKLRPTIKFKM